jgi:hypothetical protein
MYNLVLQAAHTIKRTNETRAKNHSWGNASFGANSLCWSAAATIAALIRSSSMPIAGRITSGCPILNRSSCAKRADIEAPMSGRISARLRSGPARGVSSRRHASGPDHPLGPLGMAKIERGGDSWRKPARARFAHRADAARARYSAQKAPMMAAPSIRMIRSVAMRCFADGWVMAESLYNPHSWTDHGRPL